MKLYFLTGLPSEMDEDTLAIADLAENCVAIGQQYTKKASVTVSLGGFVPKPHTPFQWFGHVQKLYVSLRGVFRGTVMTKSEKANPVFGERSTQTREKGRMLVDRSSPQ